jgi:GT2 family glycosyltransferase
VSGCALFLRKDLFEELSGFDESFFLYYEDIDLCRRAKEKGITVSYRSDLPLIHLGGKSQPSLQAQKREYFRSQCRYFQKHRPYGERLLLPLFQKLARLRS